MTSSHTKAALVTGASRGIGRAIALKLSRDGFAIAVNYAGNAAKAAEVVREIGAAGGRAVALQADIADPSEVERLFDETAKTFGSIDVVVNSAGVMAMLPIAEADVAAFDALFATNVRGTFNVLGQAARRLPEGGRIITLSSSVVAMSFPAYGPYAASKAAVEVLTRTLANELRGRRIAVNAVAPGPTATDLFFDGKTDEQVQRLAKLPPLERLGTPEDIANVVAFLAGPEGGWINGQVVRANGGYA